MIEKIANKLGARFDPSFSWGSAVNFIGILITLIGVVGGYYVLTYRVGLLEVVKVRSDSDHDKLNDVANDVKWIRAIIEKRTESGLPSPFDPVNSYAMRPTEGHGAGLIGVRKAVD